MGDAEDETVDTSISYQLCRACYLSLKVFMFRTSTYNEIMMTSYTEKLSPFFQELNFLNASCKPSEASSDAVGRHHISLVDLAADCRWPQTCNHIIVDRWGQRSLLNTAKTLIYSRSLYFIATRNQNQSPSSIIQSSTVFVWNRSTVQHHKICIMLIHTCIWSGSMYTSSNYNDAHTK